MKIIIASDSFKGSLTSAEVASAVAEGVKTIFPDCETIALSIADGGEGTTEALMEVLGGRLVGTLVHDPLMRPVKATYGISPDGRTAIMEMASASGLPLLSERERNPLRTTTFGTGEMIADACRKGCRHFLIGIGGSATNDAGTGMLSALGFRFLDSSGKELTGNGENLEKIERVESSGVMPEILESAFTIACDVSNPFCGPDGAAYIFAPQKGADPETVRKLDRGMQSFASVTERYCSRAITRIPGTGAAGGLGGAFLAYLNARLVPGSEMILEAAGFDTMLSGADLVITGEGRIDSQTAMGKLPYAILKHASAKGIPVIAITGSLSPDIRQEDQGFSAIFPIIPGPQSLEDAMNPENAATNIRRTVSQIMRTARLRILEG